jgi:peptidylprolyl isomerase
VFLGPRRRAAILGLPVIALVACGSSGAKSASSAAPGSPTPAASGSTSAAAPATTTTTAVGVKVGGGFAVTPTVSVPATPAPTALTQQTLVQGSGAVVAKGDTLVANYVGQTWAEKSGQVNVFDSSFSRGTPAAFLIGAGAVIPGWDDTLVGKKLGSRVLLTIPPADGYGSTGASTANISGTDTLVFVVDLIATYKPDASAPGTAVTDLPTAGLPKIINTVGKQPTIVSTAGVKVPAAPVSTLLVSGTGAKIDSTKTLVLQLVQTDLATGKSTQSTWGQAPQSDPASSILGIADKLTGQNIGSRVVVLLPAAAAVAATATSASEPATPPVVLIIDVVGQF